MLYYGRNCPELTHALGTLDVNDMDQLETLIYGFVILIAYQCIDLPDKYYVRLIFKTLLILIEIRHLSGDAVAGNHSCDSQHGNGLGRAVTQLLRPRQCIQ